MQRSKAYYIVRGIARALTQLVIASMVIGAVYVFILLYWAALYP
jgi:hypothetical protein